MKTRQQQSKDHHYDQAQVVPKVTKLPVGRGLRQGRIHSIIIVMGFLWISKPCRAWAWPTRTTNTMSTATFYLQRKNRCMLSFTSSSAAYRHGTSLFLSTNSNHENEKDRIPRNSTNCIRDNQNIHQDLLLPVEQTIRKVLTNYSHLCQKDDILTLPATERETLGIARHLDRRLKAFRRNNDCPRCWMQRAHCICKQCPPLTLYPSSNSSPSSTTTTNISSNTTISKTSVLSKSQGQIHRIFVLFHHKEIALKVDTAKLILAAFPDQARLVVSGIGPKYQDTMKELMEAVDLHPTKTLILFPDETALTYHELLLAGKHKDHRNADDDDVAAAAVDVSAMNQWNLVVLDGTWAQARKSYQRYFSENSQLQRVQLSSEAVDALNKPFHQQDKNENTQHYGDSNTSNHNSAVVAGHQLRRHSIAWRQIGTFEATRLFLRDIGLAHGDANDSKNASWALIEKYQRVANDAARKELGPPREA